MACFAKLVQNYITVMPCLDLLRLISVQNIIDPSFDSPYSLPDGVVTGEIKSLAGDRSGVLYIGSNQDLVFDAVDRGYLPANLLLYQ